MSIKTLLRYNLDIKIVIVAAIYYLSALLGYNLVLDGNEILPAWPPSGIAFALIILLGRSAWPGITIGALIANMMAFWNVPDFPLQSVIYISTTVAVGYTLEALLGNYLVKNWIKNDFPFQQTRNAFRFLFVTVLISFLGSGISIASLLLNGIVASESYLSLWISLWVGNVVGILLFTPFVLSMVQKFKFEFTLEKLGEVVLFGLAAVTLGFLFQLQVADETIARALPFLVIPFLLWLAFRFHILVAMSAVVISSVTAIYLTTHDLGPFVLSNSYNTILLLQIYIGVVSITTIILSATVKERALAESKLLQFNESLEEMVKIRTKALNKQIDTRKKAEEDLQHTNDELVKRNVELDNFVYSVSHDLRAPIASMLGIVNLAKKEEDLAMKNMYFDMINGSAEQLDNFIKEILEQSQNARSEVKQVEVPFKEIIDETFKQLQHASQDGRPVKRNVNINMKKPFISDPWRIKVILNNLISNAIRYRNGKAPVIDIELNSTNKQLEIIVRDNGRGISKEHLDKVCDMFYRATDDGAGSGLGLYIVKETVNKLGGEVSIDSEEGNGTKVKVSLPLLGKEKKTSKDKNVNVAIA